MRVAKLKPKDMPFLEQILPGMRDNYNATGQALRSMLEGQTEKPVLDEPALPVSSKRFLA
jgi:hypothetical protein